MWYLINEVPRLLCSIPTYIGVSNISPAPTVIYVDDVAISTARLAESATLFVLPDSQSSATSFFLASVPILLKRELALGLPEPRIHWPRFVATGGSS